MKWQLALIGAAILNALGSEATPEDLMASPLDYRIRQAKLDGDLDDEDDDDGFDPEAEAAKEQRRRPRGEHAVDLDG